MEECDPLLLNRIRHWLQARFDAPPACELFYTPLRVEHLQEGPTCGFVCMQLALLAMGASEVTVDALVEAARRKGYTRGGELFSGGWWQKEL